MFISAIQRFREPRVTTAFYGRDNHPVREPAIACGNRNPVAISGGLALAFLGTSAVTGIARTRVPHMISSALAIGAALFHVQSLAVRNNRSINYSA